MSRDLQDARRWVAEGTKLFLDAVTGLSESGYDEATALPGWTRRHLVAHVAANADALVNLVRWAATGVPTSMYSSPEARAAAIERGSTMGAAELDRWLRLSAAGLDTAMCELSDDRWRAPVVTAHGRTVPATEIPWLRAREVCVHMVDLDLGASFAALPADFLEALCTDVVERRGNVPDVGGPLDQRVAWLTGRPHRLVGAPSLGAWL